MRLKETLCFVLQQREYVQKLQSGTEKGGKCQDEWPEVVWKWCI